MEYKQFKEFAKDMVDYIGDYLENIRDRYIVLYMYVLCG
jgi:aromatic-L-amino-acid decarboxylase